MVVVIAAAQDSTEDPKWESSGRYGRGQGQRILVVDDEPALRGVVTRVLTQAGYTVVGAGSGEEAAEILEHETFHLVLTDVVMPGMLGSELVHRLRVRAPETPVVYMSAFTAQAAQLAAEAPLLDKPFDPQDLLAIVGRTLARAGGER